MEEANTEYCYTFAFWSDLKLDKKTLSKEFKGLREMGLVEFHKGLFNEDGETIGSGYRIVYAKLEEIRRLIEQ